MKVSRTNTIKIIKHSTTSSSPRIGATLFTVPHHWITISHKMKDRGSSSSSRQSQYKKLASSSVGGADLYYMRHFDMKFAKSQVQGASIEIKSLRDVAIRSESETFREFVIHVLDLIYAYNPTLTPPRTAMVSVWSSLHGAVSRGSILRKFCRSRTMTNEASVRAKFWPAIC